MNGGRSPVPGEVRVGIAFGRLLKVRGVAITSPNEELRVEAILDTGSTYCVVSHRQAAILGYSSRDRLGTHRVRGVGGVIAMDRHRFEHVQVGTARAHGVDFLVGDALPGLMLLGMSFIGKFTTTLDLDANRVIFRPRAADR